MYQTYCNFKNLIKNDETSEISDINRCELIEEWKLAVQAIEDIYPSYHFKYEYMIAVRKSFTPEQIDFICHQIGDWYIEWKHRIVIDLKKGTHRLGFAKEELKKLICGE